MDKDKLIKLIKLANNNPNDNEANLAARKVCKLLAENNFAALNANDIRDTWDDLFRGYSHRNTRQRTYTGSSSRSNWVDPNNIDQRDEPDFGASSKDWEDYYRQKREQKSRAKKWAGHIFCKWCLNYTNMFVSEKVEWRCSCGKTTQSEVNRAQQAASY